jgi:hypothetical protein
LRVGRFSDALRHARRFHILCSDPLATRLLAVSHLLSGNWPAATALARITDH